MDDVIKIVPQDGPQWRACESTARIVIVGGAAGGGKSYFLLLDPTRHVSDPTFNAIIFRRKYTEIVLPGALWDTSMPLYKGIGGIPVRGRTEWRWPGGGKIKFSHLSDEKNAYDHQGGQYAYIGFDELTEFSWFQFMYLMTRNRPPEGCLVKPRIRATCNPDADSWVSSFISWWWDPKTGYAIPERSGILRYFHIVDDKPDWVDDKWRDNKGNQPISVTFIGAKLDDNKILVERDPTYRANLAGKALVIRERLLEGNWLITFAGNVFDPAWFEIVDEYPKGMRLVRYWDLAETEVDEKDANDPDWTAGALGGIENNIFYIVDILSFRKTPGSSEDLMRTQAEQDGPNTAQWWEEVKANGKYVSEYLKKVFSGYEAHADPVSGSKIERALPWAAWAEFKRVKLVRGPWNHRFLGRAGKFPKGKIDEIDATSGLFKVLVGTKKVLNQYIPELADGHGHLVRFSKELTDFQKITAANVEIYVALWAEGGAIYGGCYIWSLINNRLRLYNEIMLSNPTPVDIYHEIREKLVVQIDSKGGWVTLRKAIGNEEFFKAINENLAKQVKKAGLRVQPIVNYDETAAVVQLNRMFSQNQIIVHGDCIESDVQIRGWMYGDDMKPAKGFPLARVLCLLVSDLHTGGRLQGRAQPIPYSQGQLVIRERLRSGTLYSDPKKVDDLERKQYEYLAQ